MSPLPMSSRVALWFAAAERDNLALALEALAQRLAEDRVQTEDAPALEPLYQALLRRLDALPPEDMAEPGDVVGFDRPATLHLISPTFLDPALLNPGPLTPAGLIQHRSALLLAMQARPGDRHVVMFTQADPSPETEAMITAAGGFLLRADPAAGLLERWLWLRNRLAVLLAQRVMLHAEAGDVLAGLAARHLAQRYGARLYLVHHAARDAAVVPDLLSATLHAATHLAQSPADKAMLRRALGQVDLAAAKPRLALLRRGYDPAWAPPMQGVSARFGAGAEHLAPLERGKGRRLPLRSMLRQCRDRVRRAIVRSGAADERSSSSARDGLISASSGTLLTQQLNTRTAVRSAVQALADFIVGVVQASGGCHLHIGPVPQGLRQATQLGLKAAGVALDRVIFAGPERSVANALVWHRVALFFGAVPGLRTEGLLEAAALGLPIALPTRTQIADLPALLWSDPKDLARHLQIGLPAARAAALGQGARQWQQKQHGAARFTRRLNAVLDATEGRLNRPIPAETARAAALALFDADWYLQQNPDVARAGATPFEHYLTYGEAEGRAANPLFHPRYYRANLPAGTAPKSGLLAHYALRGEARGHAPHPLFVPHHCARFLPVAADPDPITGGQTNPTILARYLASGGDLIAPHPLFDPGHYARRLHQPSDQPLLLHFLDNGAAAGLSPHPLIEADVLKHWGSDPLAALLAWLSRAAAGPDEPAPALLFAPAHFCGTAAARYGRAAPCLLWAHLIEGNRLDHGPHPFVQPGYAARRRPQLLQAARPLLSEMARGRFDEIDTHPLIHVPHLLAQAPWIAQSGQHPTRYFTERAVVDNLNPHPWFSTQFYLLNTPDVAAGVNPLLHYLGRGQFDGRLPHPFFDGNDYYHRYLRADGGGAPLLDYTQQGAGQFRPVQPHDPVQTRLALKTARALFAQVPASCTIAPIGVLPSPDPEAADLAAGPEAILRMALHPDWAAPHPSLRVETKLRASGFDPTSAIMLHPRRSVSLSRPAVMSGTYLAPPAARYDAPAVQAAAWPRARVIAGNDGFLTAEDRWHAEGPECGPLPGSAEATDPDLALRETTAVVALRRDAVLLRHIGSEQRLARAVLACGSRSWSFDHFLLEVLPRVLAAAQIAPAGTPLLTEDDLPAQHYQALRLCLPTHPILRLARGASVEVATLYAANMAQVLATAQPNSMPGGQPGAAALRLHPALLAQLNTFGRAFANAPHHTAPRRLFLCPAQSPSRGIANLAEITALLDGYGFTVLHPEQLDFATLVGQIARAETIVAADCPHLAALAFAAPGTRVFPLLSNAPGTDFHRWDLLGRLCGLSVITLAGWQLQGSAGMHRPAREAHFTVPLFYFGAFFGSEGFGYPLGLVGLLDGLRDLSDFADVLTGSWAVVGSGTPLGFLARLAGLRRRAVLAVLAGSGSAIAALPEHRFFADYGRALRSGFSAFSGLAGWEQALAEAVVARLAGLAAGETAGAEAEAGAAEFAAAVQAALDLAAQDLGGQDLAAQDLAAGADPEAAEWAATLATAAQAVARDLAQETDRAAALRRVLALAMLLVPNWRMALPAGLWPTGVVQTGVGQTGDAAPQVDQAQIGNAQAQVDLAEDVLGLWLHWATMPPFLHRAGEDAAWVAHVARLLNWVADGLDATAPQAGAAVDPTQKALRQRLLALVSGLDLGQLLLVDVGLGAVQAARNRVLEHVALREGPGAAVQARTSLRPVQDPLQQSGQQSGPQSGPAAPPARRRIGILCRTFEKGPDSEAVVAFLQGFDRSRYEIFAYSVGFRDRVVSRDPGFDARFDSAIAWRRTLPADPAGMRALILADQLDVLLYANATTYGIQPLDLALYHRVAPVQLVLNSHLPMAMGYPSFDAVLTGLSDDPAQELDQADYAERLLREPGPVISYLTSLQPRQNPPLDRAALGLATDAVVMMNAGSALKLRAEALRTMMQAVVAVPKAVLLLAPYNPGWAARSLAFGFNAQLAETAAEVGLDPARIIVLGELSVAEAEAALACADLYLNPFPHGGATMTHLALIYGVPPVTLRRRSTRSIDQFLVQSLGFDSLLVSSPAEYVARAQQLGCDAAARGALARAMAQAARQPVFVDNLTYSQQMQTALEAFLAERGG